MIRTITVNQTPFLWGSIIAALWPASGGGYAFWQLSHAAAVFVVIDPAMIAS